MKITSIHLKNLNSLRGEWKIDFSAGSYGTDGIFAITGPTGAGKTTIFDAVCLALYAQTPRLGKVGGQNNEIMSKHTNECFADVTFSVGGKTYLCSWRQHKAGKGGKLQTARHVLAEYPGNILTEQTSKTVDAVQEITGMDFRRFRQAVMLEQGGFDAFLKANAGERSQILELLTGTEIYGQISHEVYERASSEQRTLEEIRIQIDTTKPRDSYGTEEEIAQELTAKRSECAGLEAEHEGMRTAIEWLKGIAKIHAELDGHNGRLERLKTEIELFTADGRKLEAAIRANELRASHAALVGKRRQFGMIRERCERNSRNIARDESQLADIETVRLPELEFEYKRRIRNVPADKTPDVLCAYAKERVIDYRDKWTKTGDLAKGKSQAEQELTDARAVLEDAEKEYRAVLARHEEIFTAGLRANLKEGSPCPVCGSTEHPAILHDGVRADIGGNIPDFEAVSKRLREAQTNEGVARTSLNQRTKELNENTEAVAEAKSAVIEALAPMGLSGGNNVAEINSNIDRWLSEVRKYQEDIQQATERAVRLRAGVDSMRNTLQADNDTISIMTGELETAESDFAAMLRAKGFGNEGEFTASCLNDNEVRRLQEKKNYLDDNMKQIQALISDRTEKLNAEQARNITTRTLEELSPVFQEHEERITALHKDIYGLEDALTKRKALQQELDGLNAKRETQERIYSEWSALSALIGQQNGNRFRIFAQRITLQMMIGLANRQLQNMNGRYTLTTAPGDDGLKLCVIDHEQAGEIRPTENLSGGERFIVSLALALGLSQISGSRAQVDSLFLDEGFGSLDDEALNTALEALGEVRRTGRMIGIISHVAALKERIAAQINVIPKREGVSILEGAGCSRG